MKQIMFSGIGGQGVILAANILANSAVHNGNYAAQSQAYGSESRGTTTRAEVIIADQFVDFPHVEKADYFLVMAEGGMKKFKDKTDENTVVIYDGSVFEPEENIGSKMINIEATKLSLNNFDRPLFANIIMLGALVEKSKLFDSKILKDIIKEKFQNKALDKNLKAIEIGRNSI
ncbi:MAG: hypothetical protein FXF47_05960 [Candidatus Mcinerneyibacterium aminivorans]|jgi:2-oxoglutarate ferredoxin oxidoreductase subunit gamma|uniref:Pyruvate/ketoisovalerate oxidoreductase catalytic domain-containing protein n=1 Tax=Candidatus Mcinerneyibacterium aminivorans TaxID=2703815 RepID=A0A5D0MKM2_9BACT|nr:MAG: hypothetical protein FXF47_05960 [Candidatus Mcinerneyibacterium aminivorans]